MSTIILIQKQNIRMHRLTLFNTSKEVLKMVFVKNKGNTQFQALYEEIVYSPPIHKFLH